MRTLSFMGAASQRNESVRITLARKRLNRGTAARAGVTTVSCKTVATLNKCYYLRENA